MKTIILSSQQTVAWLVTTAVLLSRSAVAEPTPPIPPTPPTPPRAVIKIESIERGRGKEPAKDVTWLGVSTEEASEALGSQLGLKSGEGLLVTYVATDSPAAKAGFEKHDVLVELGDQLLVHPAQLAKLIRSQKEGDTVKLTFYRRGKKQTVSVTLGKRTAEFGMLPEARSSDDDWKLEIGDAIKDGIHEQMKTLHQSLMRAGADKQRVKVEVERSVEDARKALQDLLRHKTHAGSTFGLEAKDLEALAHGGVDIGKDATVIVRKGDSSVKTIVKSDDAGVIVIVASPKKHLTAHDKDGKLLFDGAIESQEEQQKVPAELWDRVKPMLPELKPAEDGEPEPHAQSEGAPKI